MPKRKTSSGWSSRKGDYKKKAAKIIEKTQKSVTEEIETISSESIPQPQPFALLTRVQQSPVTVQQESSQVPSISRAVAADSYGQYYPVLGDGNCLFRSVSLAVFNTQENHANIRQLVVDHVFDNWEDYRMIGLTFAHDDINSKYEYRNYMSQLRKWGTELECAALSKLFQCRIKIIQNGLTVFDMDNTTENSENNVPPIILRYSNGNHYDLYNSSSISLPEEVAENSTKIPEKSFIRKETEAERKRIDRHAETQQEGIARLQQLQIAYERTDEDQKRVRAKQIVERKRLIQEQETREQQQKRLQQEAEDKRQRRLADRRQKLPTYLAARNAKNVLEEYSIGLLDIVCSSCNALHFRKERPLDGLFKTCCHKGKVELEPLREYPELLYNLLTKRHPLSKRFIEHIRSYNNALAFASIGVKMDMQENRGSMFYRIHGQMYHKIGNVEKAIESPAYGHLYFFDTDTALRCRMERNNNAVCIPELLEELDRLLRECNPFAEAYRFLREVEQEEIANGRPAEVITMQIREDRRTDLRRYNQPTANEVAVVFRSVDGEPPLERDVRVYLRNGPPERFQIVRLLSPNCDPLCYPILFPRGEPGWQQGIPLRVNNQRGENARRFITHLQFYSYRFSIRPQVFNPLLNAAKLTQQFIVDAYVKVESNRLNYYRTHQADLRVEQYQGLMDYVHNRAERENVNVGRMVILPSSFSGSPRSMVQHYHDCMAIITKFGRPDLFITFTCNPRWREVEQNLEPWQRQEDRPDLVSRVFRLKLQELMDDLKNKHVFGVVVADLYVIEFQKRGLPHAHILIILEEDDKIRDAEDIDQIVSAEFPSGETEEDQLLLQLVKDHMIHGPCGALNPNSPCMKDGQCSKRYPKSFQEDTIASENGYPTYRRQNTGRTFVVRNTEVDNRFVVPYNKWLLKKYNCHLNVEICSSVKSVKYICKYVHKGYDCALLEYRPAAEENQQELDFDEIRSFQDSRYVSAPESIWRIFEFEMHDKSHTVYRLAVHLPLRQQVYFRRGEEDDAFRRAEGKETTLTAWFNLNARDERARNHLYTEIPLHYVFQRNNTWQARQRGGVKVIPRMYTVPPRDNERFHLRTLLLHVRGAQSYEDLRTVEGVVCDTFKEACRLRNLLLDDSEWFRCLEEAVQVQMPKQLRQLYAMLLVFCNVANPQGMWNNFVRHFVEDFVRRGFTDEAAETRALMDVQRVLLANGTRLRDFGIGEPENVIINFNEDFEVVEERNEAEQNRQLLNECQTNAFDRILAAIEDNSTEDRYFFIDGPGGSGKTFLYNTLIGFARGQHWRVLAVAWTGIAATLLKGGRTVHSQFKLPVPLTNTSTSAIAADSLEAADMRNVKVIVWDEATMASVYALRAVDRVLRDLRGNERPFGGVVMVLGGDFRQCLPVVPHGNRTTIVEQCIKNCNLWNFFVTLRLNVNMRLNAEENVQFAEWLLSVGEAKHERTPELSEDTVALPNQCIVNDIVTAVYGEEQGVDFANRAILCPKNEECFVLNDIIVERIPGNAKTYFSVDSVVTEDEDERDNFPLEFLNSITPAGMPPHKLTLKVGTVVMLVRNIDVNSGLCNGTRLIVRGLMETLIDAEIVVGNFAGNRVFIPRMDLAPSDTNLPFVLKRRQFPIRIAFAITINKAQGQTLDRVGIYLKKPVFGHGQLYVALSRVKEQRNLHIEVKGNMQQGRLLPGRNTTFTKNVVYEEVL